MAKTRSKKTATPEAGAIPASGSATQDKMPVPDIETAAMPKEHGEEVATTAMTAHDGLVNLDAIPLVVLGTADALPLLTKVWRQKAPGEVIVAVEVGDGPFSETIDRLMTDETIPDVFALVPANCFPTHRIDLYDVMAYRVRRKRTASVPDKWVVTPCTGLPFLFKASVALPVIEQLGDAYSEEEFLEAYNAIAHPGKLPEEIGMTFGNTVSYAVQPPKCKAVVAEALVRKRFICATGEGYAAIKDQLALLAKDE